MKSRVVSLGLFLAGVAASGICLAAGASERTVPEASKQASIERVAAPVSGKTRAEVRAELGEAIRRGDFVVGFPARAAREVDPDRYQHNGPDIAEFSSAR